MGRGACDGERGTERFQEGGLGGERLSLNHKLGAAGQKGLFKEPHSTRYQEVTQTAGKVCPKAPGFGRDMGGPSKHGEMLSQFLSLHYQ